MRTFFFGVCLERAGALTRQLSSWDSRPGIVELVVTLKRQPFVQKTYQSLFLGRPDCLSQFQLVLELVGSRKAKPPIFLKHSTVQPISCPQGDKIFELVKDRRELSRVAGNSEVANEVVSEILHFIELWSQGVDAFVVHISPNI